VAGNAGPRVKAYSGRLPANTLGYEFETDVAPTNSRVFFGELGAEWVEGSPGVNPVPNQPDHVKI
jgi:hypothetical protein